MSKVKTKTAIKANPEINPAGKVTVNLRVKKIKSNKVTIYKDKQTRVQILQSISENTNLSKSQIEKVFDELNRIIEGHLRKRGSGEIIIPKIGIKLRRIKKKATKERNMVSPLTGQNFTISAKPARLSIKLSALKILKEVVNRQ